MFIAKFLNDFSLAEILSHSAHKLIRFVSLARKQNDVALFSVFKRIFYRLSSVGYCNVGTRSRSKIRRYLADYCAWRLVIGIIRGKYA